MQCANLVFWISVVFVILQTVRTGSISWDSACGVTKGCFPNCPNGCEYLVTWLDTAGSIAFTLKAEETDSNAYLAIGFSDDLRMGDDSVVGCILPGNTVESWYNEGTDSDPLSPASTGLTSTSVSQTNGIISCSFTRAATDSNSQFFDLNNDYRLMLLIGESEQEDGSYKMEKHTMIPWTSDGKVDFQSTSIYELYKNNSPLVKLHGIMMVLAWMFCCTVGIVIARYNKDMIPEKKLFGTKYWFQLHRGSMIGVVIFGMIGFIPIFVELSGYSQLTPPSGKSATSAHPVLGIIVTVLMFLNPIMALFRPDGDHKFRWLFNWSHLGVGIISLILAVVSLMTGIVMERAMMSTGALVVGLLWIFAILILGILMEAHKWMTHFKQKKAVGAASEKKEEAGDIIMEEKKDPSKIATVPFILLVVFVVVIFGFTIATLGIIAAS